jgi:hypothetical protein
MKMKLNFIKLAINGRPIVQKVALDIKYMAHYDAEALFEIFTRIVIM